MLRHIVMTLVIALIVSAIPGDGLARQDEPSSRPAIWVRAAERPLFLDKIEEQPWARQLFEALRSRADQATPDSPGERRARIMAMPLVWPEQAGASPVLQSYARDTRVPVDPAAARQLRWGYPAESQMKMLESLQDAIDCGVLYYLTEDEKYAICAADVLHLFVSTLTNIPEPDPDPFNGGWLYRTDHLLEARLVGAQLPIIYDLIYPYLVSGGEVYDVGTDSLQSFAIEDAQVVFRTYANLALHRGLYDSNWPLLELPSLINNVLALDDPAERADLLLDVLERGTDHQPSFRSLNSVIERPGDVWPESLSYSFAVGRFFVYAMALIDRNFPDLQLGRQYPNILGMYDTYYSLQFPNDDYPAFGDSRRKINIDYVNYEFALAHASAHGDAAAADRIRNILLSSAEAGRYDRGVLPSRNYGPEPYRLPLQLFWSVPDLEGGMMIDLSPPRPRTLYLPFAGISLQRNVNTDAPELQGLMAVMGGAAYIHGHASGIDLELYGQGEVLGVESGRGVYGSDMHENYYRLFAAHNTVISNGASASAGQWVGLGTDTAEVVAMEPAPGTSGVSGNHSFATMAFRDDFNLVGPAEHERTVALVRLSPTHGYYVDVFRARSAVENQFHDYVYRNLGETVELTLNGAALAMVPDPERYAASSGLAWARNATFRHPGWHFFEDVESAEASDAPVMAEFTAADLGAGSVRMRALIPGGQRLQVTRVTAPPSSVAEPPYDEREIPAFVLRREGEAWSNPFVVLYESDQGSPAVRSVERLMDGDRFKGVRVTSTADGRDVVQYILIQEPGQTYTHPDVPLAFIGRFGILTLSASGEVIDAYIGDGHRLSYGDLVLTAGANATSASWTSE